MKNLLLFILFISLKCFSQGDQADITVPYNASGAGTFHALLHLPNDYASTTTAYPLFIFCHGAGEASQPNDLAKIYTNSSAGGPAYFIAQKQFPISFINPADGLPYKFIVVSPQAFGWSASATELNYIIPYLVAHYRIDPTRIYGTGLSAGGESITGYASHYDVETGGTVSPSYRFAAIVPMSSATGTPLAGWGTTTAGTDSIHAWGFGSVQQDPHGENTKEYIDFINAARPGYGVFTNYSGGHCCWNSFYNPTYSQSIGGTKMNIYEWLLQYKRGTGASIPPPVAGAGVDQSIILPTSSVTVTGQGLAAAGHSIIRYAWTQISGPSTANIAAPTISTTVINTLVQGVYSFRLTVTDDLLVTGTDDINITVASASSPNQGPTVTVSADQSITIPTTTVTLIATATDPEGDTLLGKWSKIKTPGSPPYSFVGMGSSTLAGAAASDTAHGAFNLVRKFLRANSIVDSGNNIAKGGTNIYMGVGTNFPNTFPAGPELPQPNQNINIDKAISFSPQALIVNYPSNELDHMRVDQDLWAEQDISTEAKGAGISFFTTGTQPRENYNQATQDKLKVINDSLRIRYGKYFMDFWTPVVVPGTTTYQAQYDAGDSVHGNDAAHAQWAKIVEATNIFQDVAISSSVITSPNSLSTTVTGLSAGIHKFMFSAFDKYGLADSKIVTITVSGGGNVFPVSNAGVDQSFQLPQSSCTVNGSASVDPDGTISSYAWTKVAGPSSFTITSPSATKTTITGLVQGVYVFTLTVTDNLGASSQDNIQITVLAAPTVPACGNLTRIFANDTYTALDDSGHYLINNMPAIYIDGGVYKPGDTLMIDGHTTYANASFVNLHGTAACPIVIMCDTSVSWATLLRVGLGIANCTFVKLSGRHPNQAYGFHVYDTLPGRTLDNVAISIVGKDSSIEAELIDVRHTQYGSWIKNIPDCDTTVNYPNWWLSNISVHNCRFRNTSSQAFYIGSTDPNAKDVGVQCEDGLPIHYYIPTRIRNIKIYNNDIDSTGRPGIQVSVAFQGNNEIYGNKIRNCGEQGDNEQGTGIVLGGYSRAYVHDNDIKKTLTWGIASLGGSGLIRIENNIIDSSGYLPGFPKTNYGWNIMIDTRETIPADSTSFKIKNNILGVTGHFPDATYADTMHILVADSYSTMSRAGNEICGNKFSGGALIPASKIFVDPSIQVNFNTCLPSSAPIANAGSDQSITQPAASVTLSGSAIVTGAAISTYGWAKISGPATFNIVSPASASTTVNTLSTAGTYVFRLTVTDNQGLSGTDDVSIIVTAAVNIAPVANANIDQTIQLPTSSVSLSGSGTDADGTISSYAWVKQTGGAATITSASSASTTVTGLVAGVYTFKLTVTDNLGATGSDIMQVTVNPLANISPTVTTTITKIINYPKDSVQLTSVAADADGTIVNRTWTKLYGPNVYQIKTPNTASTWVTHMAAGYYTFRIDVIDNGGATATNLVSVIVKPSVIKNTSGGKFIKK